MLKTHLNAVKAIIPISALLVVLAGCASSGATIDRDIDLAIAPSVEQALSGHKPAIPVLAELVELEGVVTIDHKGNLGLVNTNEQKSAFQWQGDGRLGSTSTGVHKTPGGSTSVWRSTSISLCGLVPVLDESANNTDSRQTAVLPAGGVFVPFGFSTKSQGGFRGRLASFSTNAANLCKPAPGALFAFQFTREEQRKLDQNLLSYNKLHTITESANCVVGLTEQPARTLNTSLIGGYLLVTCSYSDRSQPPRKSEFAYLLSSGLYLPLSVQRNEYQADRTRYTALRYK